MKRKADVYFKSSSIWIRTSFHPAFPRWVQSVVPYYLIEYIAVPPTWIISFTDSTDIYAREVYDKLDKFFIVKEYYSDRKPGWAGKYVSGGEEDNKDNRRNNTSGRIQEGDIFSNRFKPKNKLEISLTILELSSKPKTKKDLSRVYRNLARLHHPDLNEGKEEKMREINAAYKIILEEMGW